MAHFSFTYKKSVGEFPTLHAMLKFHSVSIIPQRGDNKEQSILILYKKINSKSIKKHKYILILVIMYFFKHENSD